MVVLVCVKRVPLTGGRIVLSDDQRAIQTRHLGFTISPHEECAAEEAVRLVEAHGGEATVLTLGPPEAEEQLRDVMAIGVTGAVHLLTDGEEWDAQATAAAIVAAVRGGEQRYDLLLFGNESADAANYQVPIRVAHALGLPCVTGVKAISLSGQAVRLEQEATDGRDVYELALPAVVSVKEGINLPRYPSVPGRLRAKRRPIQTLRPQSAGARLEMSRLRVPPQAQKQARVLGRGAQAAPAVVDVLAELGLLAGAAEAAR
jgi:electron transfer flavoprotein beta subunit